MILCGVQRQAIANQFGWITRFTEENRAALDWLNRVTTSEFQFFGIELEVFKIGDSIPAPLFQLISKPND